MYSDLLCRLPYTYGDKPVAQQANSIQSDTEVGAQIQRISKRWSWNRILLRSLGIVLLGMATLIFFASLCMDYDVWNRDNLGPRLGVLSVVTLLGGVAHMAVSRRVDRPIIESAAMLDRTALPLFARAVGLGVIDLLAGKEVQIAANCAIYKIVDAALRANEAETLYPYSADLFSILQKTRDPGLIVVILQWICCARPDGGLYALTRLECTNWVYLNVPLRQKVRASIAELNASRDGVAPSQILLRGAAPESKDVLLRPTAEDPTSQPESLLRPAE